MTLTEHERAELTHLGRMDPELKELLKNVKMPEYDYDNPTALITQMRKDLDQWYIPLDPNSGISEKNVFFEARDGHQLRLLVFQSSAKPSEPRPLVIMFHGGGFTMGSPENNATLCRLMVQKFGVVCVAPSYRLAPEHPFPTGINDAWDAFGWIAANAASLGTSPETGFILGGVSAGGNITSVLAHRARDENLQPRLTGILLQAPSVLPPAVVPEKYKDRYLSPTQPECLDTPILGRKLKKIYNDANNPDVYSALYASFNWPTGHKGLPPHYFQVCGQDQLRDEALIYESVLREENDVETRIDVYPGQPHIFWSIFRSLKATRKFSEDFVKGIAWLLKKEGQLEE